VSSGSVSLNRLFIAIELEKDESARIIDLLNDVESNHAGLFPTVSGIHFRFCHELIQRIGLNVKMHHDGNHRSPLSGSAPVATDKTSGTPGTKKTSENAAPSRSFAAFTARRLPGSLNQ
jgi:hypothetical protein